MIRILLADDDALVRAGLRMLLTAAEDIAVVAEAADGQEVPALVRAHSPDLVLMDIRMPGLDGLEATRLVRALPEPPHVVVLTTFTTDEYLLHALRAGAAGFLLKHTAPDRIVEAVRRAVAGEPVMSPEALGKLIGNVTTAPSPTDAEPGGGRPAGARFASLGEREQEVAREVAKGRTNAQIAEDLYMSVPTVKSHVSHILAKLGLDNRVQIALLVYRAGLL
ncbi:response regulator transcription factor [Streptomyces sp. WAC06614]|uniref:response regulator n=1 Tax=Streptomyces sp. WAC06614 TaxID=2487416 RepID=UPI000F78A4B3|nr:response regulator transcription factor [Streptomyces sp. WAC06614]RSS61141.1 DNA-binding response regulator [Streptomyces sp. WAC06614]